MALAATLAGGLTVSPSADAEIGQERSQGDYALLPTAQPAPSRGKSGPSLAVDPANENHIVELHQEITTQDCEYNVSFDGGATWEGGVLTPPASLPTSTPCSVHNRGSHNIGQKSIAFGSAGNVFATWTAAPTEISPDYSVVLSRSTDGGRTFATGVAVAGMLSGPSPAPTFNRPELVVERRGATTDRIYVVSRDSRGSTAGGDKAIVVRSDDSGETWSAPIDAAANNAVLNPPPAWNAGNTAVTAAGDSYGTPTELTQPVLGPAPAGGGPRPLYLGWNARKRSTAACPPNCEIAGESLADTYLVVARSDDMGATWTRTRAVNLRGFVNPSGTLHSGSNYPRLAIGPEGNLYTVFNQGPGTVGSSQCGTGPFPAGAPFAGATTICPSFGAGSFRSADHFINWDADVWFMRSTDRGATWGQLKQINDPKTTGLVVPEITQTRHPDLAIAPDGRIDIVWHDRRHWYLGPSIRKAATAVLLPPVTPPGFADPRYSTCVHSHLRCEEVRLGDTYYARSNDAGVTFAPNRRVNDRSSSNDVGHDYKSNGYWDYGPAVAPINAERLLVADMDSRNGNVDLDTYDITLRQVNLNAGAGPIPVVNVVNAGTAAFSVEMSKRVQPGGSEGMIGADPGSAGSTSRVATKPVIVNEGDMAGALAAGALARANVGPLLASPAAGLPAVVKAEVARLQSAGAFVIGDTSKLSATVVADLQAAGVPSDKIVRIEGGTAAEVAANIARSAALDRRSSADKALSPPLPAYDAVIIANPNSASAASAAALAANRRLPVLYVDTDSIPAATSAALSALSITKTLVIGSTGVISHAVQVALPNATRLGGGDQYAVSNSVVGESLARGLPRNIVYVADGNEPMQGALMGAAVARLGGLLTLAPGGTAAAAEATVNALGLRPSVDRLVTANLTGVPTVGFDPLDVSTYRLVASDGGIFAYGNAGFFGSTGGITLNQPIVGSADTPSGKGYWLVASDGGIFNYGDAGFFGSAGSVPLVKPIVGMASTPSGRGYWLVASDGGIFNYGDAAFKGSTGGIPLARPVVGMAPTPTGQGYFLVASDGGIFAYGDAAFKGSTGGIPLVRPVVGMTTTSSGRGYWLVASDGGVFAYGEAGFLGSTGGTVLNKPVVGMTA